MPFVAAGAAIEYATGGGVRYFTGVLLALIATVIYVLLGGYRATAWNAVFLGLIGIAALWVTLFYMWTVAGGWKSVLAKAVAVSPKTFVAPGPIGIQAVAHHAALMVIILWSVLWWPHIFIQPLHPAGKRTV